MHSEGSGTAHACIVRAQASGHAVSSLCGATLCARERARHDADGAGAAAGRFGCQMTPSVGLLSVRNTSRSSFCSGEWDVDADFADGLLAAPHRSSGPARQLTPSDLLDRTSSASSTTAARCAGGRSHRTCCPCNNGRTGARRRSSGRARSRNPGRKPLS